MQLYDGVLSITIGLMVVLIIWLSQVTNRNVGRDNSHSMPPELVEPPKPTPLVLAEYERQPLKDHILNTQSPFCGFSGAVWELSVGSPGVNLVAKRSHVYAEDGPQQPTVLDMRNAWKNELEILGRFKSYPHIAQLHDSFKLDGPEKRQYQHLIGYHVIVMKHAGNPFGDRRKKHEGTFLKSKFTLRSLRKVLIDFAKGLECMYSQKIFHGDLKPVNLCVNKLGEGTLIDFEKSGQPGDMYAFPGYEIRHDVDVFIFIVKEAICIYFERVGVPKVSKSWSNLITLIDACEKKWIYKNRVEGLDTIEYLPPTSEKIADIAVYSNYTNLFGYDSIWSQLKKKCPPGTISEYSMRDIREALEAIRLS